MAKLLIILMLMAPAAKAETTFLVDVLPIVDKRCAICHVEVKQYDYLVNNENFLTSPRAWRIFSKREREIIKNWIKEGKKK